MRPDTRHGSNKPLIVGLLITLLLLLGAGVGVFIYDSYQPKVMASGHRWILSPTAGNVEIADGNSSSDQLSYGGNVKLFTLVYSEEMTKGVGEQIREAKCHVLIDLPPEGVMSVTGGGNGSDGSNYREVRFRPQGTWENEQQYKELRVAFHVEKGELTLVDRTIEYRTNDRQGVEAVVAEESPHGPLSTAGGNIFVVRLDSEFNIVEVTPLQEEIRHRLDDAAVSRLMSEHE
jgi:hypothetical protein